uniref:Uncharacterized protein n=1 Tax=Rhinolophus ferrumequinum TaxID=59479 RepID=A0A671DZC8_RHIFE
GLTEQEGDKYNMQHRCGQSGNGRTPEIWSPSPRSPGNEPREDSTYMPAASSSRASLARLWQARSQVCSAAWKSRCTTKKSAASSSRTTAADWAGATRTGSLLCKGPPTPLRGAADVEGSVFIASLGSEPVQVAASPGATGYPDSAWEKRERSHSLVHNPSRGRVLEKEKEGAKYLRPTLGSAGTWGSSIHLDMQNGCVPEVSSLVSLAPPYGY